MSDHDFPRWLIDDTSGRAGGSYKFFRFFFAVGFGLSTADDSGSGSASRSHRTGGGSYP